MHRALARLNLVERIDLEDDRVLIGVTGGMLWLVGALAGGGAQLLPGAPGVHEELFLVLLAAISLYGLASIYVIPWKGVSVRSHAMASASLLPVLGVALWATGGSRSYLQPLLIFVLVHVATFFRPRLCIPLTVEMVLVFASPLAYEAHPTAGAYPARVLSFAVAAAVLATGIRLTKGRLVAAEDRQRRMALADALTGLVNRRGFDAVLQSATAGAGEGGRRATDDGPGFALILFDLDDFKRVNDTQGHPAGDRLLCAVATHCAVAVRPGDTLARIGGDEFAVVAPGAGEAGARQLAEALAAAATAAGVQTTVAWAVHPRDGETGEELLRAADRRLYAGKAVRAYDAESWSSVSASSPSA